ncbi:MAG: hypothetical protein ACO3EZ_00690 [Prochlorotrichaceae cyanobacterium]
MTTKFSRASRVSQERLFNLDSLERNHWRNRINQLKRELRSSPYQSASTSATSLNTDTQLNTARPLPRRRPSR